VIVNMDGRLGAEWKTVEGVKGHVVGWRQDASGTASGSNRHGECRLARAPVFTGLGINMTSAGFEAFPSRPGFQSGGDQTSEKRLRSFEYAAVPANRHQPSVVAGANGLPVDCRLDERQAIVVDFAKAAQMTPVRVESVPASGRAHTFHINWTRRNLEAFEVELRFARKERIAVQLDEYRRAGPAFDVRCRENLEGRTI
jgi:hypothetical protein